MWIPATAALLLLGGAAASPRPAPPAFQAVTSSEADLEAAFIALEDEYTEAYNAWRTAYSEANAAYRAAAAENPDLAFEAPERVEPSFFPRFDRLAAAGVGKAQLWCLANYSSLAAGSEEAAEQKRDFARRVMGLLMNPDANHAALPRIISSTSSSRPDSLLSIEEGRAMLTLIETTASSEAARSASAYALAGMPAPEGVDEETAAGQKLAAMRALAERYPETREAKRAGGFVFQQENLQIGMIAPDIIGKDVDGHDMKLSDFRGKVTVIDFWGFW
ncbi:thiol-disulfide oxidoreductase [Planctomycetes bacterium Poly30]|uniref:Thiol-disulfide oxidoreductase n=1 Tax=Saltatorellus ferox TaxID=2528018 RepID=A0A518EX55_9BACT|nr:thiol-disulfide oxidoreductase [Planctomycetes bacterium Poly30]